MFYPCVLTTNSHAFLGRELRPFDMNFFVSECLVFDCVHLGFVTRALFRPTSLHFRRACSFVARKSVPEESAPRRPPWTSRPCQGLFESSAADQKQRHHLNTQGPTNAPPRVMSLTAITRPLSHVISRSPHRVGPRQANVGGGEVLDQVGDRAGGHACLNHLSAGPSLDPSRHGSLRSAIAAF